MAHWVQSVEKDEGGLQARLQRHDPQSLRDMEFLERDVIKLSASRLGLTVMRTDIIVTCTYHAVLVSNDQRNGFTSNAARVSVAAAGRLMRLAVDYLLASEDVPPTLEEACATALTPFPSFSFTRTQPSFHVRVFLPFCHSQAAQHS